MRLISLLGLPGLMLGTAVAAADFVPGRFYAPRYPIDGGSGSEGIWEFDPLTGTSRVFAQTGQFGRGVSGLAFTPDGRELRASVTLSDSIIGLDGDGVGQVVLDSSDGIGWPFGSNNLAYDQFGNFFVVNLSPPRILSFPPDGGPGSVFATTPHFGSIAPAPDGSLYLSSTALFHVLTSGALVQFDNGVTGSVATTRNGDLFVLGLGGVYRFPQGNPDERELLAPNPEVGAATLVVAPDELSLLVNTDSGAFYSIDIASGDTTMLGRFPGETDQLFSGVGFAVAVPEPSGFLLIALIGAIHATRSWFHPRLRRENRRDGGHRLPSGGKCPNTG